MFAIVHIVTDDFTLFYVGTAVLTKQGNTWYLDIDMSTSNITPTHRAVTRVQKDAAAISATWVYSGYNNAPHPYKAGYEGIVMGITFRGRLDNRDTGRLELHGRFYY